MQAGEKFGCVLHGVPIVSAAREYASFVRILYFDIDSLRPDHLGCYGYRRATSPNIDAIAARGMRFGGVYASDVPCLPSRTAFFGGRFGTKTGVVNHGGRCADLTPQGASRDFRSRLVESSLGSQLSRLGYRTVSISPFPRRHSAYQVTWGFHETIDTGNGGLENADEIFEPTADWIRRNGASDSWFLHVNMWDPHTPYDTPEAFGNPFAQEPGEAWLTPELLEAQRAGCGPHSAREVPHITPELPARWRWGVGEIETLADAKTHWDGYDTGVKYSDHYIGELMSLLDDLGVLEETAIVVAADHGENLGELNVWGDHQTADETTCHIPCIVRWPGVTDDRAGESDVSLRYHLDLAATIVECAGAGGRASLEEAGWDGRSLFGPGREALFLSQGAWSCQRAVRWDRWILIQTVHTGLKVFPQVLLFDLESDPHETRNVAAAHPALVRDGLGRIQRWFGEASSECPLGDPFEVVLAEGGPHHANERSPMWEEYCSRLESSGRADHAEWFRRYGGRPRG